MYFSHLNEKNKTPRDDRLMAESSRRPAWWDHASQEMLRHRALLCAFPSWERMEMDVSPSFLRDAGLD